jgi:PAS domain S-box-containing protein/diguanylate cyclase (GGDEF)-like protein
MSSALPAPLHTSGCLTPVGSACQALAEQAQTGLFVVQDERIAYANPALAELLGWPIGELIGQPHQVTTAPAYREHTRLVVQRRLQGKTGRPGQMHCLRRDGSTFEARVFARRIEHAGQPAVLVTLFDITELQEALQRVGWNAGMLARTEALCRSGSFEIDWPGGAVTPSSGLRALVGLDADASASMHIDRLDWIPPEERAYVGGIWRNARPHEPFEFQHRVQCADGRRLVVLHRGVLDDGPRARGVAILQDITAQREAEQRIHELASQDEVTGLPNRAALLDQLDAAMHVARRGSLGIVLLTIDVPRITEIKSSMGFGAGDTLAMALAARLVQACGAGESVAQLGDSEFALMIETGQGQTPRDLIGRAEALQHRLLLPVRLGTTEVFPQGLVGIASFPADADTPAGLLEAAQTARLDIRGSAGIALFRQEVSSRARRDMAIESALRKAIDGAELSVHYQPQVDLSSGALCGAEALLRWTSEELGVVTPSEFIPIAERSGLIGAIGDWVLRHVCEQLAVWRRVGLPAVRVGVNLSPAQLQRPDLARHVQQVLLETGARAADLGIELTESMLLADVEQASAVLRAIKAIGVEISLDDFGTGYSSLSSLSRLPIDVVKVDRSFVHDVSAATQQVSVTRAIINMAHGLQMQVLAEGVETEGQLSLLASNGCDRFQGFWFSKPLRVEDFEALLREGRRLPERLVMRERRQRTLLLVDDEENIVASLKRLLRRDGYHIITATSAAEGLQRLAEHEVDVIVSDQRMPGMTGVEFLHRAKALYPQTVRMVLSGYTELQSIIDAVNEGAIYKFLTKPWDDTLLRSHIAEAFRQKELADENLRLTRQLETANADLASLNERLERLVGQQRDQAELLAASANGLRDVLDDLPVGVLGVDPEGMVAYANLAAERTLCSSGSLLGRPALEALPEAWLTPADLHTRPCPPVDTDITRFQVLSSEFGRGDNARGQLLILLPPCIDKAA